MKVLKTIGDACKSLKEECYTSLLKNSRHVSMDIIKATAKKLAVAY